MRKTFLTYYVLYIKHNRQTTYKETKEGVGTRLISQAQLIRKSVVISACAFSTSNPGKSKPEPKLRPHDQRNYRQLDKLINLKSVGVQVFEGGRRRRRCRSSNPLALDRPLHRERCFWGLSSELERIVKSAYFLILHGYELEALLP